MDKYETAKKLFDSAWAQRICLACQSDWSFFYTYGDDLLYDFEEEQARNIRARDWKYSREKLVPKK